MLFSKIQTASCVMMSVIFLMSLNIIHFLSNLLFIIVSVYIWFMKNYEEVSVIFLYRQHQEIFFSYQRHLPVYLRCYSLTLSAKGRIRQLYCFTCWFSRFCYDGRFIFLIQLSGNIISILPGRVTISICINISLQGRCSHNMYNWSILNIPHS